MSPNDSDLRSRDILSFGNPHVSLSAMSSARRRVVSLATPAPSQIVRPIVNTDKSVTLAAASSATSPHFRLGSSTTSRRRRATHPISIFEVPRSPLAATFQLRTQDPSGPHDLKTSDLRTSGLRQRFREVYEKDNVIRDRRRDRDAARGILNGKHLLDPRGSSIALSGWQQMRPGGSPGWRQPFAYLGGYRARGSPSLADASGRRLVRPTRREEDDGVIRHQTNKHRVATRRQC